MGIMPILLRNPESDLKNGVSYKKTCTHKPSLHANFQTSPISPCVISITIAHFMDDFISTKYIGNIYDLPDFMIPTFTKILVFFNRCFNDPETAILLRNPESDLKNGISYKKTYKRGFR